LFNRRPTHSSSLVAAEGSTRTIDHVLRTQGAFHEALEITQGWTPWFETAFYVFTSLQPDTTWEWAGDHIRPRVRVPESWHLPVGLSFSSELGYQRRAFSVDTWTLELRPIIDKQWGPLYISINPALDRAIQGESVKKGFEFSPAAKTLSSVCEGRGTSSRRRPTCWARVISLAVLGLDRRQPRPHVCRHL
jgi:hypothetical protein